MHCWVPYLVVFGLACTSLLVVGPASSVWPATGDGRADRLQLAIPSLLFFVTRRLLPEFPWSSIHASGPEVAATNILTGSVVDGDASSPTAQFSLSSLLKIVQLKNFG